MRWAEIFINFFD